MNRPFSTSGFSAHFSLFTALFGAVLLFSSGLTSDPVFGRVLDDFNDGVKSDWTDFTFVPGFGLPREADGRFVFELPPAGQSIFTASQKTSEVFELKDGRTVEFRVDLVQGGGKDSFAILCFIPTANPAGSLAGYGLAKSTTDVLVTKGINKYFYNENPTEPVKNENVTLVLRLTGRRGNVEILTQVLDKENGGAVLFERRFVDTPAAEVFSDGEDDPAAPFLSSGYFTLYAYEDFDPGAPEDPYRVVFDNAEVSVTEAVVVDDFEDGNRDGWTDFTFIAGFGLPVETSGRLRFELPPAGQAIFTATQKTSEVYELTEGEEIGFQVDVVEAGGKDSFAVLAFIPTANSAGTLEGYGFAKSTTDILITKGVNKYFYNENPPEPVKNQNITLSLSLVVRGGNVIVTTRVLDKDANDAVLFEKIVIDTPNADVFSDGEDSPAAPFLGAGYFTLYAYEDFDSGAPENPYLVVYDNAVAFSSPKTSNAAPILSDVVPADFSAFLPATAPVAFTATDDAPLAETGLVVTLNGERFTAANGLKIESVGAGKRVTLQGLEAGVNYEAILSAEDADGKETTRTIHFDTFSKDAYVIEVEDYNFEGGRFIDKPVPDFEGGFSSNSYSLQIGFAGVDFSDTRTAPNGGDTLYRSDDPVRMQRSRDFVRARYAALGGADQGVYDYDVGDLVSGEWMNYTRTFPEGAYEIYLRQAVVNMAFGESVLELVTGDPSQPDATTRTLGSFLGTRTGFQYRNFALTDGSRERPAVVRLNGKSTLRLRHVTGDPADGGRYQNYLIFLPVPDPGLQRASVTLVSPAPDSNVNTVTPAIEVVLQNRDTAVQPGSIRLTVNGVTVNPVVKAVGDEIQVRYALGTLPASDSVNTAKLVFEDNEQVEGGVDWKFTVRYRSIDPGYRQRAVGTERGFRVRVVQAPVEGGALENSLDRAENQLRRDSNIPSVVDVQDVVDAINFNKRSGETAGSFDGDRMVPGIDPFETGNGDNDFAVEILTWVELPAGIHRFGVISDDGYKIVVAKSHADLSEAALAFHNGGTANETFDFVVTEAGLYPFRMVWYERGGTGYAEWFSEDRETGNRILINAETQGAFKAWRSIEVLPEVEVVVEVASDVSGPFSELTGGVVDSTGGTVRFPVPETRGFYRLRGASALRITRIERRGGEIILGYE